MNIDDFINNLRTRIYVNMPISKPSGTTTVISIDDDGFKYSIENNGNNKKIKYDSLKKAIIHLLAHGEINRKWFNELPESKSNPCNYTTIGGLLVDFGLAVYNSPRYIKK